MLIFGNAETEAKYHGELREAVREQFKVSKSRTPKVIIKAILKKHPKFAQDMGLVDHIVSEELTFKG